MPEITSMGSCSVRTVDPPRVDVVRGALPRFEKVRALLDVALECNSCDEPDGGHAFAAASERGAP